MSASVMITYPQKESKNKLYAENWIGMKLDEFDLDLPNK